jgi:hypothetical protein
MARSYQERIDARMAEGWSRAQARGHPGPDEPGIRDARENLRDFLDGASWGDIDPLVRDWAAEVMAEDPDRAWDLIQAITEDGDERHELYSAMSGSP